MLLEDPNMFEYFRRCWPVFVWFSCFSCQQPKQTQLSSASKTLPTPRYKSVLKATVHSNAAAIAINMTNVINYVQIYLMQCHAHCYNAPIQGIAASDACRDTAICLIA